MACVLGASCREDGHCPTGLQAHVASITPCDALRSSPPAAHIPPVLQEVAAGNVRRGPTATRHAKLRRPWPRPSPATCHSSSPCSRRFSTLSPTRRRTPPRALQETWSGSSPWTKRTLHKSERSWGAPPEGWRGWLASVVACPLWTGRPARESWESRRVTRTARLVARESSRGGCQILGCSQCSPVSSTLISRLPCMTLSPGSLSLSSPPPPFSAGCGHGHARWRR